MSHWIPNYSVSEWLEVAGVGLAGGDPVDSLWSLVSAWSQVRDPTLAATIERLSNHLADAQPPLAGATKAERDQEWRERHRRGGFAEHGLLLRSLGDTDPTEACRRLELLRVGDPDPRLAAALCSMLLDPPFGDRAGAKFWERLHAVLLVCADPRSLARLEQAAITDREPAAKRDGADDRRRRAVAGLREELESLDTELSPAQLRRLGSLEHALNRAVTGRRQLGPELLAAVFEDPKDLARRQVYADCLIEQGDPRGEFIALQLAELRAPLDKPGRRRMRELLSQGQRAWVDPLDLILIRPRREFTGGFLSAARIRLDVHPDNMHRGHQTWATVEVVEHAPYELLEHPIMRSLRAIAWVPWMLGQAVHRRARLPTVEHLGVNVSGWRGAYFGPRSDRILLRQALVSPKMFPALQSLAVHIETALTLDQVEWLWTGSAGRRLRSIELQGGVQLGLVAYAHSIMQASAAKLERVEIRDEMLHACFSRVDGAWSRVELSANRRTPAELIGAELRGLAGIPGLAVAVGRSLASRKEPELRAAIDESAQVIHDPQ